jgi:hypothetical protein
MSNPQPSDTVMEIGRNLHPRRYRRFTDLRPDLEAVEWSRNLDWRNNPYDRFLLRREILHHLEATSFYEGGWNIYSYASRREITAEVDRLLDTCPQEYERGAFHYVLVTLPWELAFKHERVRYSRLAEALAKTSKE